MLDNQIYQDIATRSDGAVMIGVVGPVRTGKSTFIKKFMETLVIPNMDNEYSRQRAVDELPLSAMGRSITTTEPKFIPNEPVELKLGGNAGFKVRLIDCVGYVVDNSLGYQEEEGPRMVDTPWSEQPMPFEQAAEIGTQKVIREHSTIGLLVTTDGSICDIPREDYQKAEQRVVSELKELQKPFIILLNSVHPSSRETQQLRDELQENYDVPVLCVNCTTLGEADIQDIMQRVLFEFPLTEVRVEMPGYLQPLPADHWLRQSLCTSLCESCGKIERISQLQGALEQVEQNEWVQQAARTSVDLGRGVATVTITLRPDVYFKVISEIGGVEISSDEQLICTLRELSQAKKGYDRIADAMAAVEATGYGIVMPTVDQLTLEEPEIVRQGGRFGIRLKASAPSIHMIRADIQTEVSPIVGSERQSEELIDYLMKDFEVDPGKIWQSNFFGKSLYELVSEGLNNKLYRMPEDARFKIQETLQKIINEGSGGLICIIL